jgi:hypothetical protein
MSVLLTNDCGITSDDLIRLLDRLTQLKYLSSNLCSHLKLWLLSHNLLDDRGVSTLIDHLPSLFPRLTYYEPHMPINSFIRGNPVSSEMEKRLEEEFKRRREEVSCSVS